MIDRAKIERPIDLLRQRNLSFSGSIASHNMGCGDTLVGKREEFSPFLLPYIPSDFPLR
jgi:hypothetical protein